MSTVNLVELEKATTFLLESLAEVLAVGGQAYAPAYEDLLKLLNFRRVLDAEAVKRCAFNLSNIIRDIKQKKHLPVDVLKPGDDELKNKREPVVSPLELKPLEGGKFSVYVNGVEAQSLDESSSSLFISIINNLAALKPEHFTSQADGLVQMVKSGEKFDLVLRQTLDFVQYVRDDLWREHSKILKQISGILKSLEAAERDFLNSISATHTYLLENDLKFDESMEIGLNELESLVTNDHQDVDKLFQKISDKVAGLRNRVKDKKKADQLRGEQLTSDRITVVKRLERSQRDYSHYSRESRAMLQEIENLRAASLRDPLTDVYNRRAYEAQIDATIAAFKSKGLKTCSLVVFDIDNFRDFNTSYGHLAGDRVLAYVARLVLESLRKDDFVFRYGGDEFVILMPNANLENAAKVAEKVRRNIAALQFKLFKNQDLTVSVNISMGVSEIKPGDDNLSFFARADKALYKAKNSGRNRVSTDTGEQVST